MDDLEKIDWDDKSFTTEETMSTIEYRTSTCKQCPSLNKFKMCKECGCFMPMKVRLKGFGVKCPLGKW